MQENDQPVADKRESAWEEVHARALARFDLCTTTEAMEMRELARQARRFAAIPGAQWEGEWGEQFEAGFRVSVNKVNRGLRKIETDYRENRIVPDFRPAGGGSDQDTANMLDGIHRADSYKYKAQQARDNAFSEAKSGGFGAYRLSNVLEDPGDKNNDSQRINPGLIITDADQCVFFDPDSRQYDKADAKYAFIVTTKTREAFADEYPDNVADWPDATMGRPKFEWFGPDGVRLAEYYEVENRREKLHILTHKIAAGEERYWDSEIESDALADKQAAGWQVRTERRERRRIRKYLMTGAEVLEEYEFAGDCIPIVPVYGQREFIDGMEYFKGHVQDRMDPQRLYNAQVSRLAETAATSPVERPIFLAEQMPPALAEQWSRANIDRHSYALVNPVIDPVTGQIMAMGPIGKVEAPQVHPASAACLQIANNDLLEDDQDGAEQVRANVSAEAMDIAATRVDAKSGIYLDNMRQSVQREGEIYISMAREIYFEEGRELETMTEEGGDGIAIIAEMVTDKATGATSVRNDLARGKYKVVASVTEATATRRDKTVRSSLSTAEVAMRAGDNEMAQAAILTAMMNQDGEGIEDLHRYARRRALSIGLVEPNEEELAQQAQEAEGATPDPATMLAEAQAQQLAAQAQKDAALAEKAAADTDQSKAKTAEIIAGIGAQDRPVIRMGRDLPAAQ